MREESCSYDKTSDVVHSLRDDIKNVLNPESHCDGVMRAVFQYQLSDSVMEM